MIAIVAAAMLASCRRTNCSLPAPGAMSPALSTQPLSATAARRNRRPDATAFSGAGRKCSLTQNNSPLETARPLKRLTNS
jgi:hypothetical protein